MKLVCIVFVLAILCNGALTRSFREKRQSNQDVTAPTTTVNSVTGITNVSTIPSTTTTTTASTNPSTTITTTASSNPSTTTTTAARTNPSTTITTTASSNPSTITTTTASTNPSTTTSTVNPNQDRDNQAAIRACIRTCPVTSEYNPVCGTDGVTYNNPSRLFCAQACGISVILLRSSRCPPPTPAP